MDILDISRIKTITAIQRLDLTGNGETNSIYSMTSDKAGGMNCEPLKAVLKTVISIESPVIEY